MNVMTRKDHSQTFEKIELFYKFQKMLKLHKCSLGKFPGENIEKYIFSKQTGLWFSSVVITAKF